MGHTNLHASNFKQALREEKRRKDITKIEAKGWQKVSLHLAKDEIYSSLHPCVFDVWTVSLYKLAVISHHIYILRRVLSIVYVYLYLLIVFQLIGSS